MQNRKYLVFITLSLSLLFQCSDGVIELKNGEIAPGFKSELTNGETLQLADFKGNYVLLHFWGSWCKPCRKNNPKWVTLHDTFHQANFKNAAGFDIISIGLEKSKKAWKKAIEVDNLQWKHHILELEDTAKPNAQKVAKLYQIKELPSSFLINPEGIIIGVNLTKEKVVHLLSRQLVQ